LTKASEVEDDGLPEDAVGFTPEGHAHFVLQRPVLFDLFARSPLLQSELSLSLSLRVSIGYLSILLARRPGGDESLVLSVAFPLLDKLEAKVGFRLRVEQANVLRFQE